MFSDLCTTGNADTRRDCGMRTDMNVVPNLNLIIELYTILDYGVVNRAAIYGRIGTDLHIISNQYAADLRNFFPDSAFFYYAETVRADDYAGVYQTSRTDMAVVVNRYIGMQSCVFANRHAIPYKTTGANYHTRTKPNILPNYRTRTDIGTAWNARRFFNDRAAMNAAFHRHRRIKVRRNSREVRVRISTDYARQICGIARIGTDDHRTGTGFGKLRQIS